jgi:hypothetical protein
MAAECFSRRVDGRSKTGEQGVDCRKDEVTYPQLIVGHAFSPGSKITVFGFQIGQTLPILQYYQKTRTSGPRIRPLGPGDIFAQ